MSRYLQAAYLCCAVLAVSLQSVQAVGAGEALSLTAENVNRVSDAFMKLLSNPYDLTGLMLPNDLSIARAGLNPQTVKAAEGMRTQLRQSLSDVVSIAVDRTSEFVKSAQAELDKAGADSSDLLQRLSSIPLKFDEQGSAMVSNPLTAIGTFLVNTMMQQLKSVRQAGGEELTTQLTQSTAGRKLLQEMDAFEASVEGELDLTQPAPAQGPAAVARQMDRMMSFLTSLTDAADDVLAEIDKIQLPDGQAETKAAEAEDDTDAEGAALRKLQQLLPDPNDGYTQAARIIFTNIFDFFRANGLYGLTPLLADVRGLFTRYGWINDLLNIIDAPLENFINANYVPLPQSNDDFVALVQSFAKQYCDLEEASDSETVLGEFEGPSVEFVLDPVECPIYQDPETGRSYVSFEDCSSATLTITVSPLTITEAYFTAAEYTGTECKYVETYGTDLSLTVGRGEQAFSFVRSAKGIDIFPTVVQFDGEPLLRNLDEEDPEPDSVITVNTPNGTVTVGNGFTATVGDDIGDK